MVACGISIKRRFGEFIDDLTRHDSRTIESFSIASELRLSSFDAFVSLDVIRLKEEVERSKQQISDLFQEKLENERLYEDENNADFLNEQNRNYDDDDDDSFEADYYDDLN